MSLSNPAHKGFSFNRGSREHELAHEGAGRRCPGARAPSTVLGKCPRVPHHAPTQLTGVRGTTVLPGLLWTPGGRWREVASRPSRGAVAESGKGAILQP